MRCVEIRITGKNLPYLERSNAPPTAPKYFAVLPVSRLAPYIRPYAEGRLTRPALTLVASALLIGCLTAIPSSAAPASTPTDAELLKQYCFSCHNDRLKTGGLALDTLDTQNLAANAEVWEKVLRKLQLGVMPPLNARRPNDAAYAQLIHWLDDGLDRAAAAKPNPGHPLLHRLNRAEYANAIRDLLGLDVNVSALLPPDD